MSDATAQNEAKAKELALAKAKELAELAQAAAVNANFKPLPQPAALANPEEGKLACAVLAAPLDDKPKAAYADWLDGQEDPRGKYLKSWLDIRVGRAGTDWKNQEERLRASISLARADMLGLSLWTKTKRTALAKYADRMLAAVRPYLGIEVVPMPLVAVPLGASHVGGLPDVPRGLSGPHRRRDMSCIS